MTGGRYLQDGVFAASASSAAAWKVAAHAFIDAPWLFAIVLAPLGVAVARNRPAAWLLAGWALLNLGLTALTGFGGSRLRCPFEVHVALLASTRRRRRLAEAAASARRSASASPDRSAAALLMVPQIARTASARANYGPRWTLTDAGTVAQVSGASGANVLASPAGLDVALRNPGPAPIRVDLRVDGVAVVQASVARAGRGAAARVARLADRSAVRRGVVGDARRRSRRRWTCEIGGKLERAVRAAAMAADARQLTTIRSRPASTEVPSVTSILATVPARLTVSSFSIFIASTTTRPWRASTASPTATSTLTTLPGIGATTR